MQHSVRRHHTHHCPIVRRFEPIQNKENQVILAEQQKRFWDNINEDLIRRIVKLKAAA